MRRQSQLRRLVLVAVLLALMLATAAPVLAHASPAPGRLTAALNSGTAVVISGAANVRAGPGVNYNPLAVIYNGQSVTLLGRNAAATWVRVRLWNGLEGWVSAPLLAPSLAIGSLPVVDAPPSTTPTAVVATGALNVRSGPGVVYGIVARIYNGQSVTAIGRNAANIWVKVRLWNGVEGWVNAALVNLNTAIGNLPLLDAPAAPTATAIVATGALNLRSGPGPIFNTVATLGNGQSVTAIGRNNAATWLKVRLANGVEGWINASLVYLTVPYGSLPVAEAPSPGPAATVVAGAVNVRYGPSAGYGVFTHLSYGQIVILLGRTADNSWVKVRLWNGVEGWVNAAYLQAAVSITTLPVAW